ncbi:hypothetical protein JKP88DRAFT_279699 [Tribonema minus]|uniref:Uncharacterized protein n=1 Tax=Tribonema minus TaxID=303371 RepID=A0A835Z138_9STRA|nr:hypothetical protein JKP88DRAFT_279699 [Tribonema minus]
MSSSDEPPAELAALGGDLDAMRAAIITRKDDANQWAEEMRSDPRRKDKFAAELRNVES